MDAKFLEEQQRLLTLHETAKQLGVSVDMLLKWNDLHILTPKITLSGQIGYTQEQINQFLTIQHTLQTNETRAPLLSENVSAFMMPQKSTPSLHTSPTQKGQRHMLLTAIGVSGIALFFLFLFSQGKLVSWLSTKEQDYQNEVTAQTKSSPQDSMRLSQQIPINQQNQIASDVTSSLHTAPESAFARNIFAKVTPWPTPNPSDKLSSQNKKVLAASVSSLSRLSQQKALFPTPQPTIAQTLEQTTLASVGKPPCPTCKNTQNTDTTTGISLTGGGANPNALTMVLGASSLANSGSYTSVDGKNQAIFLLLLGSFVLFLLLKKQFLTETTSAVAPLHVSPVEKVLEVNQKMDGTVVISFQGKDYKISKPELDSDSDRFFERLLQLLPTDAKEMEYESLTDTIRLTTPLSRIVTRLGFVGIKRDLFFPRTSKHRVLFRKYITRDDLRTMHLPLQQLAQQFASFA